MAAPNSVVVFNDLTGGVNLVDAPYALAANQCQISVNIEWVQTKMGRCRHGSTAVVDALWTVPLGSLARHVPGTDETAAEVWGCAGVKFGRMAAAATFSLVTSSDAITGNAWDVTWATVGGKLFVAYKSAVNRLHVWDGASLRRTGISSASNVMGVIADTGVGAYAAVPRWYRVRWLNIVQNIVSEPTGSQSFTPNGASLAARIPRPVPPGEGEDTWIVEASSDNVTFYQIGQVLLATLTFDDSNPVAFYSPGAKNYILSPLTGSFNIQPSYRFIAGADNRLLGFGTFSTTAGDKQNRAPRQSR
jgi:hypothetical protein